MSDETFADLFQEKTAFPQKPPARRPGRSNRCRHQWREIFLDAGGKSEGVLGAAELRNETEN